jgi:hypothetical protein
MESLAAVRAEKAALLERLVRAQESVASAQQALDAAKQQASAAALAQPPPPLSSSEAAELRAGSTADFTPEPAPLPPTYTVRLQPSALSAPPLGSIEVSFAVALQDASSRPSDSDFLALYRGAAGPATPEAAHSEHVALEYLDGALQGVQRLVLPSTPPPCTYSLCYIAATGEQLCVVPIECALAAATPVAAAPKKAKAARPAQQQQQQLLLAPFLMETQPRISTFQLTVPFPEHLRSSTAAPAPGSTDSSSSTLQYLPKDWLPGVHVEGDQGDPAGGSLPCTLFLGLQLPRFQGRPAYAPAAAPSAEEQQQQQQQQDVYALRLPLSRRVESSKVLLTVQQDHVSLRLPMYYSGSAVPDKPPSLVSLEEMASLRANAAQAACRFCAAPLLQLPPSLTPARQRLRVVKLPSEHWLEWTDFWVCHDAEDNALLPKDGVGDHCGIQGTLLVGECTLQVHLGDTAPGALLVAGGGGVQQQSHQVRALECARCRCALGTVTLPQAAAAEQQQQQVVGAGGAGLVELVGAAGLYVPEHPWPRSLTSSLHPTVKLHKDALLVPSAALAAPPPSPSPALAVRPPSHPNALFTYTLTSRLACSMLAAASALRHYNFAVIAGEGGSTELLCHITLLNWNTSLRVGLASGSSSSSSRVRERWVHSGDLPCLKLRYKLDSVLAGSPSAGGSGGGVVEPEVLSVTHEEARELVAVLLESTSFLPPSQRHMDGASIGFLPFMAAPLRLLTH